MPGKIYGRGYPAPPQYTGRVGYFRPSPLSERPIAELIDDFDDDDIDLLEWANNVGTVVETGGRIRIDCDVAQWASLRSATSFWLDESQIHVQAFPAAATGAATAYLTVLVLTSTAGTAAGFSIDTGSGSGNITMFSWVGFADASTVTLTYSPTDHAWLQVARGVRLAVLGDLPQRQHLDNPQDHHLPGMGDQHQPEPLRRGSPR